MTPYPEKNQSLGKDPDVTRIMELIDKNYDVTMINIVTDLMRKHGHSDGTKWGAQQRSGNYKKEESRNSRTKIK